jgi:hypothetical protein
MGKQKCQDRLALMKGFDMDKPRKDRKASTMQDSAYGPKVYVQGIGNDAHSRRILEGVAAHGLSQAKIQADSLPQVLAQVNVGVGGGGWPFRQ